MEQLVTINNVKYLAFDISDLVRGFDEFGRFFYILDRCDLVLLYDHFIIDGMVFYLYEEKPTYNVYWTDYNITLMISNRPLKS